VVRWLVGFVLVALLTACAASVGAGVRVTRDFGAVRGCRYVGEVKGFEPEAAHMEGKGIPGEDVGVGGPTPLEAANPGNDVSNRALTGMKTQAAALGGNVVVLDLEASPTAGVKSGRAYRCANLPSVGP
jgi:uncharacterized protein YbjQ (UPF0145 family)